MSKILLTGATGYIGRRLLPVLLENGHQVTCLVRDRRRLDISEFTENAMPEVIEGDLLDRESLNTIPDDIEVVYYLVHSMASTSGKFQDMEETSAQNFIDYIQGKQVKQVIYLGGIVNDENLSSHLESRLNVEKILGSGEAPLTVLRAAIIIGSGSASFEIIRDLVE